MLSDKEYFDAANKAAHDFMAQIDISSILDVSAWYRRRMVQLYKAAGRDMPDGLTIDQVRRFYDYSPLL